LPQSTPRGTFGALSLVALAFRTNITNDKSQLRLLLPRSILRCAHSLCHRSSSKLHFRQQRPHSLGHSLRLSISIASTGARDCTKLRARATKALAVAL
jgi:hypothetical protein